TESREENARVEDGILVIEAHKEAMEDNGFTSARLVSRQKGDWQYGYIEIKAKLPAGRGTWPAIWMLNTNITEAGAYWEQQGYGTTSWPHCGEIDILEHWGKNQDYVSSAVHTTSSYGDQVINVGGKKIDNASTDFHTYGLEWTKEKLVFSVDGDNYYSYQPTVRDSTTWPFDMEYYFLLNIAIERGIDSSFQESPLVVDYIRVYQ
ncbi:MAG TPA: hypothetical protein DCP28_29265, partial [Cytophagales bacterium]|nr:hypothetical protein [Cytophagales bacterium]